MELSTQGVAKVGDAFGPYTARLEDDWVVIRIELTPTSAWSVRVPARDIVHMAQQVQR